MKIYTFNENGVCTNPDAVLKKETKQYAVLLKVCQLPSEQWTYGYVIRVAFGNYGVCGSPVSVNGPQFDTREEATKAVTDFYIKHIQEMIQSAHDWNQRQKEYVDKREERNEARLNTPKPQQATLF